MHRRTFLRSMSAGALGLPGLEAPFNVALGAASDATTGAGTTAIGPEITDIRYPLAFVPAIREPGERLRVELDPAVSNPTASLRPQVGAARPTIELEAVDSRREPSTIWRDETVRVIEYAVPPLRGDVVETQYDLLVAHDDGSDGQRGAVSLVRQFPDEPTVVVFTDSHIAEGGYDDPNHARRSGENMVHFSAEQALDGEPGDRWEEVQRVVAELNLLDPDLILSCGDYFSVQDYPAKYFMEYKDGHRIYSRLNAPVYTTIGNHDGYVETTVDGIELYERFMAPAYYSLDIRPGLRLVSANTYDWSVTDRSGFGYAVSAWGGQVRDEQLAWLRSELRAWRAANPDGDLIAIGHHNPAEPLDSRGAAATTTAGVPPAEQVARGVDSQFVQGGQTWYGDNRLAFRDLLAEVDVSVYFTGHTHRDLLSRYHAGNVASAVTEGTTPGLPGESTLTYRRRDGTVDDGYAAETLREIIRTPAHGPLFVETACVSSATNEYDGYRVFTLDADDVDPAPWGYPADADGDGPAGEFAEHAALGLYARPSFALEAELVEQSADRVAVRFTNDLVTPVDGASILSLSACRGVSVDGGRAVWRRRHDGTMDVKVAYTVPARSTRTVRVQCHGRGRVPTAAGETDAGLASEDGDERSLPSAPTDAV